MLVEPVDTPADRLLEPPNSGGVWVVGNSITETAIDRTRLSELVDLPVGMEYHGATYTLLVHQITRNALPDLEAQPAVVVWGFRPHTAAIPGLRVEGDERNEWFRVDGDAVSNSLLGGPTEPWLGAQLSDVVADGVHTTGLWRIRRPLGDALSTATLDVTIGILDRAGASGSAELLAQRVRRGDQSLGDVVALLTSNGRTEFLDELVDDLDGVFVSGDPVPFSESLVPVIAAVVDEAGYAQVVVMHGQRDVVETGVAPDDARFAADARKWFDDARITLVDVFGQDLLEVEDFGGGDHLASGGRTIVTPLVADAVIDLVAP